MSVTLNRIVNRIRNDIDEIPEIPQLTQQQLSYLLKQVFFQIGDALSSGEDVYLEGFGRFHPDVKPPRKIKSGFTSETHVTGYKIYVKFTPFKQLNTQVASFLKSLGFTEDDLPDNLKGE